MVSSNSKRRQQNTSQEAFFRQDVANTQGAGSQGPSFESARTKETTPNEGIGLLEKILERENMLQALRKVERNQGAPGIVARKVKDKRVLKLIRAYLESGVLLNGVVVTSEEGTMQGGLCKA